MAQEATANWRFCVFTRPLAASVEHETAELMLEAPMDAMDAMDAMVTGGTPCGTPFQESIGFQPR